MSFTAASAQIFSGDGVPLAFLHAPNIIGEALFITVLAQMLVKCFSSTCQKCGANNLKAAANRSQRVLLLCQVDECYISLEGFLQQSQPKGR